MRVSTTVAVFFTCSFGYSFFVFHRMQREKRRHIGLQSLQRWTPLLVTTHVTSSNEKETLGEGEKRTDRVACSGTGFYTTEAGLPGFSALAIDSISKRNLETSTKWKPHSSAQQRAKTKCAKTASPWSVEHRSSPRWEGRDNYFLPARFNVLWAFPHFWVLFVAEPVNRALLVRALIWSSMRVLPA